MHRIRGSTKHALLGLAAAAVFITTGHGQISDAVRGAASERNHFIETPQGVDSPGDALG